MLVLKEITKVYQTGGFTQKALNGVNLTFRSNEFVSILGPSGSGKTTLLNIIGGLDQSSTGEMLINGQSVANFKDKDWDAYRNHKVGFVFQSYNLISHQSVLENVELALTLSGVSKDERKKRAEEALIKVGLGQHIHKQPAQLSGGQMQRVAIARALVNDPEILLADEPTGALDGETSFQIMELLKEIASNRLVIMVTHNPELADDYSTRIITLKDGQIISDSNPYQIDPKDESKDLVLPGTHMSFWTALSLSFNNLKSKKWRTLLTGFAGSIGIIGIALILSLAQGVQDYIDQVQEETLTSYPLVIEETTMDLSSALESQLKKEDKEDGYIYGDGSLSTMTEVDTVSNDLTSFRNYIEDNQIKFQEDINAIHYNYPITMNIYHPDISEELIQVNPSQVPEKIGMGTNMGMAANFFDLNVFHRIIDNNQLIEDQYDLLGGRLPEAANELVFLVNANGEIDDYTLYSLGLKNQGELDSDTNQESISEEASRFKIDDLLGLEFKLVPNSALYEKEGDIWIDKSEDPDYMRFKIDQGQSLKVVGVLQSQTETESAGILYTEELIAELAQLNRDSEIGQAQLENEDKNVFTGLAFGQEPEETSNQLVTGMDPELMMAQAEESPELQAELELQLQTMLTSQLMNQEMTYDNALENIGIINQADPTSIEFYAKSFESKDNIADKITSYNDSVGEDKKINYTDEVGLIMSSVTSIINMITYVLVGFVGISLIVSSIMIGIITYISVIERTKEIGILRSVGATKGDISRVFNAETIIEGFLSGVIGVAGGWLLSQLVDKVVFQLTGVAGLTSLTWQTALALVTLSIILTFIAGLIPSRMAANRDPIQALRSE